MFKINIPDYKKGQYFLILKQREIRTLNRKPLIKTNVTVHYCTVYKAKCFPNK